MKTFTLCLISPALTPTTKEHEHMLVSFELWLSLPTLPYSNGSTCINPSPTTQTSSTEETDSFVNKLDPSKVFKSKNKTIIPKKKGPVQSAGGQKGPSGPVSTSKSSFWVWKPCPEMSSPPLRLLACPTVVMSHRCPGRTQPQSLCVEPQSSLCLHLIPAKAEKRFLSPSKWQNPRPFTPIGLSQELEGHIQVSPRILPHTHYSRLRHLLLLGDMRNVCKVLCK